MEDISILHLTNTNINYDGRILKEIACLSEKYGESQVSGFCVYLEEDAARDEIIDDPRFKIILLISNKMTMLPRGIRYIFALIEFTIRAVVYGLRAKPSLVHCHDTFALPAGAILSLFGTLVIYDAHELESNKKAQTKLLSKVTYSLEKICWSRISGFITVSGSILEWYKGQFKELPSQVVLNSPVIEKQTLNTTEPSLREKFEIPEGQLVFIYVGILSDGRGIDDILDAFSALEDSHVVFLGYGPMQNTIESYSRENKNIHYHRAVAHDRVTKVVASADYGFCLIENCSLSDYLCLPNKLFEYAFSSVKVIASDFPEIKKVVEDFRIGVILNNGDKLVNVVSSLESSESVAEPKDLEYLSWESQKRNLNELYARLLSVYI